MVEVIGIILICLLINNIGLTSLLFFSIGIGISGALHFVTEQKIQMNKVILISLQVLSTIFISLSLLNEIPFYFVFIIALGMCMFYILYNSKKDNNIRKISLLILAYLMIDISFAFVLNVLSVFVFSICLIGYLGLIYKKKPVLTEYK